MYWVMLKHWLQDFDFVIWKNIVGQERFSWARVQFLCQIFRIPWTECLLVLEDGKDKIKVCVGRFWTEPSSWRGAAASWLCLHLGNRGERRGWERAAGGRGGRRAVEPSGHRSHPEGSSRPRHPKAPSLQHPQGVRASAYKRGGTNIPSTANLI